MPDRFIRCCRPKHFPNSVHRLVRVLTRYVPQLTLQYSAPKSISPNFCGRLNKASDSDSYQILFSQIASHNTHSQLSFSVSLVVRSSSNPFLRSSDNPSEPFPLSFPVPWLTSVLYLQIRCCAPTSINRLPFVANPSVLLSRDNTAEFPLSCVGSPPRMK